MPPVIRDTCDVCGEPVVPAGKKRSTFSGREYALAQCPSCRFALVVEPWTDYDAIYDEAYYRGRGANPHDDYFAELDGHTARRHAWRGMQRIVGTLTDLTPHTRWLDYGCGLGGFVQYLREHGTKDAEGHDVGYAAEWLRASSPEILVDDLERSGASYDVITAIEVIEHSVDPVGDLRRLRALLRPGGVLFLTTGNARPFRGRLERWWYVMPDVHVSFFEPSTLALALERAGFAAEKVPRGRGWDDLVRYKVVHVLPRPIQRVADLVVPWRLAARLVDRRYGVSEQPAGRAR